jgi:hypothetical protein
LEEKEKKKIILPDELQKEIMKFFLKTSIPRIARKKREEQNNTFKEGQENK